MAVISFDLSATASWPSTRRWRLAQAETRCKRLAALAPGVGAPRGLAVDGDDVGPSASSRGLSTQPRKQALNSSGSSAFITSPRVSWLGMPCS